MRRDGRGSRRRHRRKSDGKLQRGTIKNTANGVELTPSSVSRIVYSKYSDLHDFVGSKGNFNPCQHVSVAGRPGRHPIDWYTLYPGMPYSEEYRHSCKEPIWMPHWDTASLLGPFPQDEALYAESMHAFKKATSQFPSDVSIANFLIEIREGIGQMLPSMKNLRSLLASGYLSFEFAWKPLLADLRKLAKALEKARKRLEWLKRRNYIKTVVHHSAMIPESELFPWKRMQQPIEDWILEGSSSECFTEGICRLNSCSCKYTVGIKIRPELVGLDNAIATLVALASTLGLNNPIGIAWNAIPWSWLVDWFFNLDNVISDLEIQVFPGTIVVLDLWHSVKAESTVDMYHSSRSGGMAFTRSLTTSVRVVKYSRKPWVPFDLNPSFWKGFDLNARQLAILAALVHERFF